MNAVVFDIRRFSVHDGSGLRTAVFFKGCPLRCAWCQNPEGISPSAAPVWIEDACIGCGACLMTASHGGIRNLGTKICPDPSTQEDWDAVYDACPTGALRADASAYSIEALLRECLRDEPFFRHGGGVTFTGGEPLLQHEALSELLPLLHAKGIHTAIETSLFAPAEAAISVLNGIDEIFADLKLMDDCAHRRYTGVSNAPILQNLTALLTGPLKDRVTVRTPLIPGITATEENLAASARFLSGLYPNVRYELLNYNPLAAAKYPAHGRDYCFSDDENPRMYSRAQMQAFADILRENGITHPITES